jgi:hypothetical protein
MSVIVTSNLVLTASDEASLTADHPIIGWDNIVTPTNISASTADANYPVTNLANPATHLFWQVGGAYSPAVYEYITVVTPTTDPVDYVAIAAHNLGSLGIPIGIGYFDASSPPVWTTLVADSVLANDSPALFRFTAQSLVTVSIRLGPTSLLAQIAVVYAGKLLVLPRKLYQGFVPIPYGRIAKVTSGRSEAGQFLGRIVTQEFVKDTVPLSLIDPTYFRDHIADFLVDSKENPFFIAWRPQTYPAEIGYCHMTNDPAPINEAPHGLIAMSLEMTGIV